MTEAGPLSGQCHRLDTRGRPGAGPEPQRIHCVLSLSAGEDRQSTQGPGAGFRKHWPRGYPEGWVQIPALHTAALWPEPIRLKGHQYLTAPGGNRSAFLMGVTMRIKLANRVPGM